MSEANQTVSSKNNTLLILIVAIISIAIGVWVSQKVLRTPAPIPQDLQATLLDKEKPLTDFSLIDHNNAVFSLESLKGNWSFLFFGYTHCPDVCPLALKVMQSVWKAPELQQVINTNLKMIFVSVDPDRDKPAQLKSYVQYYTPSFIGVTGQADEIDKLTTQIGILYGFDEPNENGDYNVMHSGQIILIDPQGNMRAVFSPPLSPKAIVKDFIQIQKYVEGNS